MSGIQSPWYARMLICDDLPALAHRKDRSNRSTEARKVIRRTCEMNTTLYVMQQEERKHNEHLHGDSAIVHTV